MANFRREIPGVDGVPSLFEPLAQQYQFRRFLALPIPMPALFLQLPEAYLRIYEPFELLTCCATFAATQKVYGPHLREALGIVALNPFSVGLAVEEAVVVLL